MVSFLAPCHARNVIAHGATLQKLAGGFAYTEGATCDSVGNVFFVDQPKNRIMEWSTNGQLSVFMCPSGHANGMEFDSHGSLIACADEHNELWAIAPNKAVTVLVTDFDKKYLNGPNDVWIAPNGGIYMTDPFYCRRWWGHT
ncbi:MAG: SMP-30/gluconolactonase/LRE family protein, partial [Limisphaerales bacterium]